MFIILIKSIFRFFFKEYKLVVIKAYSCDNYWYSTKLNNSYIVKKADKSYYSYKHKVIFTNLLINKKDCIVLKSSNNIGSLGLKKDKVDLKMNKDI